MDQFLGVPGLWWTPNSNNKLNGLLTKSQEGEYQLKLDNGPDFYKQSDLILGEISPGKKVTLVDCFLISHQYGSDYNTGLSTLGVGVILENVHLSNRDESCFKSIVIQSPLLHNWANYSGLSVNMDIEKPEDGYNVHYSWLKPKEYNTVQGHIVSIHSYLPKGVVFPNKDSVISNLCIEEITKITITPPEPFSLEDAFSLSWSICYLISLLSDSPLIKGSIELTKNTEVIPDGQIHFTDNTVKVHYHEDQRIREDYLPRLIKLSSLEDRFEAVLSRWFELYQCANQSIELFFSTMYSSRLSVENYFLNLMNAIETFHRTLKDGRDLPEEHHNKRINLILSCTPIMYQDWLKSKLQYSNEKSLVKRIKELLIDYCNPVSEQLGDYKKISRQLSVARNTLTHRDQHKHSSINKVISNLPDLITQSHLIFRVMLLSEIWVPEALIKTHSYYGLDIAQIKN